MRRPLTSITKKNCGESPIAPLIYILTILKCKYILDNLLTFNAIFKVLACLDNSEECELKLSPSALGQSYSETYFQPIRSQSIWSRQRTTCHTISKPKTVCPTGLLVNQLLFIFRKQTSSASTRFYLLSTSNSKMVQLGDMQK